MGAIISILSCLLFIELINCSRINNWVDILNQKELFFDRTNPIPKPLLRLHPVEESTQKLIWDMPTPDPPPGILSSINGKQFYYFDGVEKSDRDKCQYRYLTLSNGLQALLISESSVDKASAALDVRVGNFYDPKEIPGLAHFLEHLLFMGTEKYPNENEYGQFLSAHGGHSNAFTAEENTNYFFDVSADHLEGALDRFAQFFIKPLFNEDGVDRELLAVDSENKKNLRNDHWRINQLQKSISNQQHPYSNFGTGNMETLKIPEIRKTLIEFYNTHYSANLMKLVVCGKDSLDELQEMVITRFSDIPNHKFSLQAWPGMPLEEEHFGKVIQVKSIKDIKSAYIVWQLPDLHDYLLQKPDHYYSHLLGHEGHGSILSILKSKGWATHLTAGTDRDSRGFAFFQLSVELSDLGFENLNNIVKLIFEYLQMLRREGPKEWIFDEIKTTEEIAFRFFEKGSTSTFAFRTAGHMQSYPPHLILKGPRISLVYDEPLLKTFLEHLSPNNFRLLVSTSGNFDENSIIQNERWYGTEYTISPLPASLLNSLRNPEINQDLYLPCRNEFLPDRLDCKQEAKETPILHPDSIVDKVQFKLWHKQDDHFEVPRGCFQFLIITPVPYASALNFVRTYFLLEMFRDSLTELLYEAELAGLSFEAGQTSDGIYFSFCGYDAKLPLLMERILQEFVHFKVDPDRFLPIKDKYARWLKNLVHDSPYSLNNYFLNGLQLEKSYWYWEKEASLPLVDDKSVTLIRDEIIDAANFEALCHGNFKMGEAKAGLDLIKGIFKKTRALSPENVPMVKVIKLREGQNIIYIPKPIENVNSAIEFYLQIGSLGNLRLRTLTLLFAQVFQEPFFDLLRTKEQLGYIVRHVSREKGSSTGLRFVVQSERDPTYLELRIESFIADTIKMLGEMTKEEFNKHIQSLISKLLAKKRKLFDETHVYWNQILLHQYDFERARLDACFVNTLTKSDLIEFIQLYVLAGSPNRKKLSIHLWSNDLLDRRNPAYEGLPPNVTIINELEQLQPLVDHFPYIYEDDDLTLKTRADLLSQCPLGESFGQ